MAGTGEHILLDYFRKLNSPNRKLMGPCRKASRSHLKRELKEKSVLCKKSCRILINENDTIIVHTLGVLFITYFNSIKRL